ncbi:hypothetical protein EDD18DRAFT_1175928, partial [Armillaria luteobubalina]
MLTALVLAPYSTVTCLLHIVFPLTLNIRISSRSISPNASISSGLMLLFLCFTSLTRKTREILRPRNLANPGPVSRVSSGAQIRMLSKNLRDSLRVDVD